MVWMGNIHYWLMSMVHQDDSMLQSIHLYQRNHVATVDGMDVDLCSVVHDHRTCCLRDVHASTLTYTRCAYGQ